jgi:hypothetical protein
MVGPAVACQDRASGKNWTAVENQGLQDKNCAAVIPSSATWNRRNPGLFVVLVGGNESWVALPTLRLALRRESRLSVIGPRLLILDREKGKIQSKALTACQKDAHAGLYSGAIAGFVAMRGPAVGRPDGAVT